LFEEHSHGAVLNNFVCHIFRKVLELELKLFGCILLQILFGDLLGLDQPGRLVVAVGKAQSKVPGLKIKMFCE
jgi:hypothetical protein